MQSDSVRGSQQIFQGKRLSTDLHHAKNPRKCRDRTQQSRHSWLLFTSARLLARYCHFQQSPIIFWKSDIANICDRVIFSPSRILQSISKIRRARFNARASVSLATDSLFKPGVFVQTRYINFCVAAACAPAYFFLLPSYRPKPEGCVGQCIKNFDSSGIILFVGTSISLVTGIAFGGAVYTWKSGQIIGQSCCSACLGYCSAYSSLGLS